jgi:type II secretory pathway pseudopilin PulG
MKTKIVLIILSIVLLGVIGVLYNKIDTIKSELNTAQINNKAYQLELDTVRGKSY